MRGRCARLRAYFRKGFGELITAAVGMAMLLTLTLFAIGIISLHDAMTRLENAVAEAGRACVTCDSLETAQEAASQIAEAALVNGSATFSDTCVTVALLGGDEWQRGAFLEVWVTTNIKTILPLMSGDRTMRTVVQIEHGPARPGTRAATPSPTPVPD